MIKQALRWIFAVLIFFPLVLLWRAVESVLPSGNGNHGRWPV